MSYKYDVALSFAGEDRKYVKDVANILKKSSIKVFYDEFEQTNLWGEDLYAHLSSVYSEQAKYTIIFCSKYYAEKLWTNLERRSAQERAFKEHSTYILPARFDQTKIPGIHDTTGYIDLNNHSPYQFCKLISEKIKLPIVSKEKNSKEKKSTPDLIPDALDITKNDIIKSIQEDIKLDEPLMLNFYGSKSEEELSNASSSYTREAYSFINRIIETQTKIIQTCNYIDSSICKLMIPNDFVIKLTLRTTKKIDFTQSIEKIADIFTDDFETLKIELLTLYVLFEKYSPYISEALTNLKIFIVALEDYLLKNNKELNEKNKRAIISRLKHLNKVFSTHSNEVNIMQALQNKIHLNIETCSSALSSGETILLKKYISRQKSTKINTDISKNLALRMRELSSELSSYIDYYNNSPA